MHTPKNTKYIANTVCTYNKFIKNVANNMQGRRPRRPADIKSNYRNKKCRGGPCVRLKGEIMEEENNKNEAKIKKRNKQQKNNNSNNFNCNTNRNLHICICKYNKKG